jgi:glycosyltransferase involved in cell wall biosynthesis
MEKVPLISVVISTFNCTEYIESTVKSAINQTYKNIEILIVDDGSTDNTLYKINELSKSDSRIKSFQLVHSGSPARTRNYGISKSCGDFIAFLDGDDIWTSDKLNIQIRKLIAQPSSVLVYSMSVTFGEANIFSPYYEVLPLLYKSASTREDLISNGNSITNSTVIVRKKILQEVGGFDEDPKLKVEDFDLWLRLGEKGKFIFIPRIHAYYRVHSNQFSGSWETKQSNLEYLAKIKNLSLSPYKFVRIKGPFWMVLRNAFHFSNYAIARMGSVYDKIIGKI